MKTRFQLEMPAWLGGWFQLIGLVTLTMSIDGSWLVRLIGFLLFIIDPVTFLFKLSSSFNRLWSYYRARLTLSWLLLTVGLVALLVRNLLSLPVDKSGLIQNSPIGKIRLVLLALFLLLCFAGVVYRFWLGIEASISDSTYNRKIRSKYGSVAALQIIGLVLVLVVLNVVANNRNFSFDLTPGYYSYSDEARSVISAIDRPIQIHSFLPVQQVINGRRTSTDLLNIAEDLRVLVEQLQIINPLISVQFHNSDLVDNQNSQFQAIPNGTFLVRSFSKVAATDTPFAERRVFVNGANDLDSFEKNIVEAIVQVSLPPSKVYFANSNGELKAMVGRQSPYLINEFQNSLRLYNLQVSNLESNPNLVIPDDARVLALIAPKIQYSNESRKSILEYWKNGGRLLIAIDATGNENFNWLLNSIGSMYSVQSTYLSMFADRPGLLATNEFGDHAVTKSMQISRPYVLMFGNAYFKLRKDDSRIEHGSINKNENQSANQPLIQTVLLESDGRSFNDLNRNGRLDAGEISQRYILAIAQQAKGRAIITADSQWLTDGMFLFPFANSNLNLGLESMLWLVGQTEIPGVVIKERSNRAIQVSDELRSRNIILGVFGFPICMLLILVYLFRWRRKRIGNRLQN